MTKHQDTGQRCMVIHRDVYGQCIVCACGKHVRPHEWMEHIGAAVEALSARRDAEAAVIEAATKYADFYDGFLATDDVLPIHDAILAAVAALRATTATEATP